ncbi:hypothetical protein FHW89_001293 [Mucilaginibacter sp. SG564]|nr:hypothetical protein [Mucilaginibacter sp. SG564]
MPQVKKFMYFSAASFYLRLFAKGHESEWLFSTRHCEEERRGNPLLTERLCLSGIATLRSQ